jgi:transcriptional regulator with XRE-family HTH domain|tara:strand:- start:889 stop:1749 length:861 start_codon:yes stop_codon:yes gene_type:complete
MRKEPATKADSLDQGTNDDFSRNLRKLCSTHRSFSEICRLTGINRQQFGRYLNGTYRPSRFNLRRICEVFGVHESDLLLPTADFDEFFDTNFREPKQGGGIGWLGRTLERLIPMADPSLRKYLGWYRSYSYAYGWPGWVISSLVCVYEHQGRVLSKTVERLRDPSQGARFVYKYNGVVTTSANRLFIAECDALQHDDFSLKILFQTHRSHVDFLTGLVTGTSTRPDRQPVSARIVLEYLGVTIDTRGALRKCGMFIPNNYNINPKILSLIDNSPGEGETVLRAIPH